ncbi:MAG: S8 family serine peptidase, partial [Chloroflexi bacterium]|nr:S8 family serine peptidase [Chloroflexota bacterium]
MPGFSGFFFDKLIKGSLLVSVVLALTSLAPVDWTTESAGAPQITLAPDDPAILVVFRRSSTSAQIADVYRQHDLKLVKRLPVLGRAERVYVPPERHAAVLAALRSEPAVELAENDSTIPFPQPVRTLGSTLFVPHPSWGVTPRMAPNDQFFRNQWAPEKINLTGAWDITTGRPEIKVAVLDSGFYADHPDRPTNLVLGPDATSSGGSGVDPVGHGTHVAGTIGAKLNNSIGVAGVAPNVTVGIVRAGGESGIRDSDAAAGIRWAVDNGFRVVNLSFGGPRPSELQRQQIDYAYGKNVIIAAAAGNCGNGCTEGAPNYVHYPSSFDHVISVAASTDNDGIADFSQRNRSVAVAAPGQQIASTMSPNGSNANPNSCDSRLLYCYLSGTSMASPHIAGIVGLMLSVNAALTPDQVVDILKATAVNLGQPSQAQGAGRVDALAAIRAAQGATGRP